MLLCPTTAGYDLLSVGYALRSTVKKVLRGVLRADHLFGLIYTLDEHDDWRDERVWVKANPLLGVTPKIDWMRRYCIDAQGTPGMEAEFKTKCCSLWLHAANSWLSVDAWDRGADPALTLDAFRGEPCWIGCDLAERDDIAAVALLFRRGDDIVCFVKGFLPELVVMERARAVPEYRAWVKSDELVTTPGNMTDYSAIEADIRDFCARFDVQDIVLERYGALNIAANLSNSGLPARIESKNPKVFTPPALELESRVRAGRMRHTGSSFLRWQISNVCVERRRDGSLLPTKESAESANKVDAIDAILLALSAMIQAPTTTRRSAYDDPNYQPVVISI
jgi:phage terminase large subunit-like protein